ncbi:glycosyltransferase [Microcoleus sp. FACHB-1515]|uniref:glycosyltransferase n=1 Tax=Cyanophyceae TaxID=3028117 RepID=UPI0016834D78|nr:glycosyltransferase [Microcoleus sp. FACHB-1515]MBD2092757.1 glycosyltransferase [Microcoleus sp. FACHB-1515]
MPLISVVIPVYNGAKTIQETIESVQKQTLSDLEIIVVDDGSQDNTIAVLAAIADPRLKVIAGAHAGANVARNRGLHASSGEYVSFLDADDLWTPNKLEAQLQALRSHPKAGVAYSWTDRIDEQGNYLRRGGYLSVNGNALAELLITNFVENGSNPLILREAAIEVGGFDECLTACQDWDMWLRLAARYEFVAVSEVQIFYRLSTNSISANVFALEACCRKVIDRAFAQAPQSLQYLKPYSLGNIYKYLTFKAFECQLDRRKSIAAAWFLLNVVINDRSMITDPAARCVVRNAIRKIAITLLPSKLAAVLLDRYKAATDLNLILCHFRVNFAEIVQRQPDQADVPLMIR